MPRSFYALRSRNIPRLVWDKPAAPSATVSENLTRCLRFSRVGSHDGTVRCVDVRAREMVGGWKVDGPVFASPVRIAFFAGAESCCVHPLDISDITTFGEFSAFL
jgi:hypothetical protein